ncbi:3-oxoacyl-ACP reductase FabG, partial [Thermodesulfobacteriota bacterium]
KLLNSFKFLTKRYARYMFDFSGKVAIITGGTRGIGRATAEAFLAAGASVIVTYASNDEEAANFKNENENCADKIDTYKFDVSDYSAVENFYDGLDEKYEKIDILVNCAGIRKDSILGMMPEADWQKVLQVNLSGTYSMCKFAVMKMMRKRSGRIINITSPSGEFGFAGQANYAASKAGQVALTKALSKEVATRGITANCVSPGYIDTDFIKDLSEDLKKSYTSQIPQKRFGTAKEVANCILFLASDEASYVNGTTLRVTGGI